MVMDAKEKAEELIQKFDLKYELKFPRGNLPISMYADQIKQAALICVDEILKEHPYISGFRLRFWQEVKSEIEKL